MGLATFGGPAVAQKYKNTPECSILKRKKNLKISKRGFSKMFGDPLGNVSPSLAVALDGPGLTYDDVVSLRRTQETFI